MKRFILLAVLAFSLTGCGSPFAPPLATYTPFPTFTPFPTLTPYPTYTPNPTYTPYPTHTPLPAIPTLLRQPSQIPLPTKTPELQPDVSKCIAWNAASLHVGETTCVRGVVTYTYKDVRSNAFFIDFDASRTSFYAVSFKYTWGNLTGQCVEISGKIAPYNGRPQIVVEKSDQLAMCE